jgi:antitoxin VapB
MAFNTDEEALRLASEVAAVHRDHGADLRRFLEHEVWPQVPPEQLGRPLSREQRGAILGYESEGGVMPTCASANAATRLP